MEDNPTNVTRESDGLAARLVLFPQLMNLAGVEILPEALRALPADFVKLHRILPLRLNNGTIHIATEQRGNQRVIEDIRLLTGLEVEETQAPGAEIVEDVLCPVRFIR